MFEKPLRTNEPLNASELDALKRLQAESGQCPQPTLAALLPALLDCAFKEEL
jgi:hypothetical protein